MDPIFSGGYYPNGVPMGNPYVPVDNHHVSNYQQTRSFPNPKRDQYFDLFAAGYTLKEVREFDENNTIDTIWNAIMVSKKCKELGISESEYIALEASGAFKQQEKKIDIEKKCKELGITVDEFNQLVSNGCSF